MLDFWMNVIISNIEYVLLLFVFFLVLFYFLFIKWFPLSKINWKRVDYIWLFLATIGIIALISEQRIQTAKYWVKLDKNYTLTPLRTIDEVFLGKSAQSYICSKGIKSKYSPKNFDEIERLSELHCEWFKKVRTFLDSKLKEDDLPNIKIEDLPIVTFYKAPHIDNVNEIKKFINNYNKLKKEYITVQNLTQKSEFEKVLFYLAPFILLIGLALRITKVTAEIIEEKEKIKGSV
ncbi:hypothetical protein ACOJTA_05715 [Malaciobacter sp. WC5094]